MVQIKDYNLALGVINNILVLDRNDKILFSGDEIKKDLFNEEPNREKTIIDNFEDRSEQSLLKEKIKNVRENQDTSIIEFKRLGKSLFLFPGNYKRSEIIILSTRSQMLQANQIAGELRERVKELKCLYDISNDLD